MRLISINKVAAVLSHRTQYLLDVFPILSSLLTCACRFLFPLHPWLKETNLRDIRLAGEVQTLFQHTSFRKREKSSWAFSSTYWEPSWLDWSCVFFQVISTTDNDQCCYYTVLETEAKYASHNTANPFFFSRLQEADFWQCGEQERVCPLLYTLEASSLQLPLTTHESVLYLHRVKFPALTVNVFLSFPKQRVL